LYRARQFDQKPVFTVFFRVFFGYPAAFATGHLTMAKTSSAANSGVAGLSCETALAELEKLVAAMEAGQLPLEEALAAYRRGADLLQHCQRQLTDAEEKVRVLDNGVLRPLDGEGGAS